MKGQPKERKVTKYEELTRATQQEFAEQCSANVHTERAIHLYAISRVEEQIVTLNAELDKARERKAELNAKVVGLGLVLERR